MEIRCPRDGRVLEELGYYDPIAKDQDKQVSLKEDRIRFWLSKGASPSKTVEDLLKRKGIIAQN